MIFIMKDSSTTFLSSSSSWMQKVTTTTIRSAVFVLATPIYLLLVLTVTTTPVRNVNSLAPSLSSSSSSSSSITRNGRLSTTTTTRTVSFFSNDVFRQRRKQSPAASTPTVTTAPLPPPSSASWRLLASLDETEGERRQDNDDDNLLRRLAEWSLQDYEWRSSVFKSNEANRKVEESIARLQGIEHPSYVRPMDASPAKRGPLGKLELSAVHWLTAVMEEEERRAQTIVNKNGKLVRPIDMLRAGGRGFGDGGNDDDDDDSPQLGPLALLEKAASDFLASIRTSETERVRTKTLRPKDLQAEMRGPLGQLELSITNFFDELRAAERLRAEFSRSRGGETVRPIDVPSSPLGEWELLVADILKAEERRAMERNNRNNNNKDNNDKGGKVVIVRPKDAQYMGPLGQMEQSAAEFLDQLSMEERQRLRSIGERLRENRPMESNRDSLLGILETILVGIVRAPQMLWSVVLRVQELLSSEIPSIQDQQILAKTANKAQQQQQQQIKPSSSSGDSSSGSSSSSDTDNSPPPPMSA